MGRLRRWRRRPRTVPKPADVASAITALAACPCDAHRTALLTVLSETDELLFLVADADRPISGSGDRRVTPGDRIALQTVVSDDRRVLLAFADEASALRHDRAAPYAGLAPRHAAARVLENPDLGGILVTLGGEGASWAVVGRRHLADLIAEP